MAQYISKDALVAEIERLKSEALQKKSQCKRSGLEKIMHQIGVCNKILSFLNVIEVKDLQEEPVSEELEEAANNAVISLIPSFGQKNSDGSYVSSYRDCFEREEFINLFKAGAKWKEEQFEKNRLKHCDSITREQEELECHFVSKHLDENNRMPTFIDAIEYGMDLQKQQMMKDAIDTTIKEGCTDLGIFIKGLDKTKFSFGDKVKVIVIKEG